MIMAGFCTWEHSPKQKQNGLSYYIACRIDENSKAVDRPWYTLASHDIRYSNNSTHNEVGGVERCRMGYWGSFGPGIDL